MKITEYVKLDTDYMYFKLLNYSAYSLCSYHHFSFNVNIKSVIAYANSNNMTFRPQAHWCSASAIWPCEKYTVGACDYADKHTVM